MLAPITLFCYRRLDVLIQTVEALKNNELAAETDLIIFSDGYKSDEDKQGVEEVRSYIKTIDGFKSVRIVEAPQNKGLANSIIDGVTEIVNQYGKIIVVEDDILTSPYFLNYMNDALEFYKDIDQVGSITSYGFEIKNMPATYFLKRFDCWGWATWKRGWDLFEKDGVKLLNYIKGNKLEYEFNNNDSTPYIKMLEDQIAGRNNSWAIRMYASQFINNKLQLHPGISLTRNIGFGKNGTNCLHEDKRYDVKLAENSIIVKNIPIVEEAYSLQKCVEYFDWLYSEPEINPIIQGNWFIKKIKSGNKRQLVFFNFIKISYKKVKK